jgi:mevalonate pyrophosphate decarboxylase
MSEAVARAHPNLALAKYLGKLDRDGNFPAVPSLSAHSGWRNRAISGGSSGMA